VTRFIGSTCFHARRELVVGAPHGVEHRLAQSGTLAAQEVAIIEEALRTSGGRVFGPSGAAAWLGINAFDARSDPCFLLPLVTVAQRFVLSPRVPIDRYVSVGIVPKGEKDLV
jgi:hypothetical protein